MSESSSDYYQRLRLPNDASRQEIKAAYRRLARQYHPDLHPNQPNALRRYRALREAYEVLVDRVQRQYYDQHYPHSLDRHPSAQPDRKQSLTQPKTPEEFYIRGVRYTLARRFRAAIGDYTQAIELDDQFAEAYLRRAEARYLIEDDSGVLVDCQRAIALNSTEAKTYFYQGMARYRLDYVQSAIAAFTDAITCDPEDAQYYYRRGLAHQDLHQIEEAAKDFRRAAQLYRAQGNLGSYEQISRHLKQFGSAGRSRPIKLLSRLSSWIPLPSKTFFLRSARHRRSAQRFKQRIRTQNTASGRKENSRTTARNYNGPLPHFGKISRSRIPAKPQQYWAPGVSSRPKPRDYPQRAGSLADLFTGMRNILRLLSNPAGEMVPLYRQLSQRQTTLVGYGLAVLANLLFISGGIHYATDDSWLVASWLWASGGMTFVMMVAVSALVRTLLRIRSLWVADIFTIGTALVPMGVLSLVSAIAHNVAYLYLAKSTYWIANAFILFTALWAISHALLTLHSGFSRIHAFPDKLSAWLTPTILVLGLITGAGTWAFLTI